MKAIWLKPIRAVFFHACHYSPWLCILWKSQTRQKEWATVGAMGKKHHVIYIKVYQAQLMYTKERFLHISSRGNQYIMVMCKVGSNFIKCELMRDKSSTEMRQAYLQTWKRLMASCVIWPKKHIWTTKYQRSSVSAIGEQVHKHCRKRNPNAHKSHDLHVNRFCQNSLSIYGITFYHRSHSS